MKKLSCLSVLILSAAMFGATAWAQTTSGSLVGVIKDQSGALVANAAVTAVNEATGVVYKGSANASGEYRILNLPAGTYDLTTNASGFNANTLKGVTVDANKIQTRDAMLVVGATTSVEVTSIPNVSIDTTTSQIQSTFDTKEVQDLPTATVGLGVLNLALLSPGVATTGGLGAGTGPSVSGQRPRNNNFTVEGIDNNSKAVTGPLVYIPNDAVGQFDILQNVFSPEYGHSTGGQFNQILVSGTNTIHGRLYEYFQNRNLNAVDARTAENNVSGGKKPGFRQRYDYNRYGGQLGGPIFRDKLFLFSNFERQTLGQAGDAATFCSPTAAGFALLDTQKFSSATNYAAYKQYSPVAAAAGGGNCAPTITVRSPDNSVGVKVATGAVTIPLAFFTNSYFSTSSLDYTLSQKDNFRVRYVYNRADAPDTSSSFPAFFTQSPSRFHLATINEIHTFSPNLSNEFRIGFNRYYNQTVTPFKFPGLNVFPNFTFDDLGNVNLGPDPNGPQGTIENLYEAVDSLTWVKGHHTMKFGVEGRKAIAPQVFVQRLRGDYEYSELSVFLNDLKPDVFGERNATPPGVSPTFYGDQTSIYAYGNDDYRVTPTLTLNLGLRYEFTSIPYSSKLQALNSEASVPGLISFNKPKPQYKNFAPRVGFAYAPNGDTSIRAGFGLGYDVLYDNLGLLSAPPQFQSTTDVDIDPAIIQNDFIKNGGLSDTSVFKTLADQRLATTGYIPDQKLPYSEQWTLGVEHVFAKNYTAEARYVGTRGIHLDIQERLNVEAGVTATNSLPTVFNSASGVQGTTTVQDLRTARPSRIPQFKAAGFGANNIVGFLPLGGSNYNGLQTQLTRRLQNGLLLNAAYTWSKTMDDTTADVFSTSLNPRRVQDFQNIRAEYTRSALDRTHRLTVEALYDIPFFKNSNFLVKNLLGNLEFVPVYTFQSPQYTTIQSGVDSNLNGDSASDRVIVNPNGVRGTGTGVIPIVDPARQSKCTGKVKFNAANGDSGGLFKACNNDIIGYSAGSIVGSGSTATFAPSNAYYVQAGPGVLPTTSRNSLPTGRTNNLDLSALKRLSFFDRYKVEVGVQALNVLNHSQYFPGSANTVNSIGSTGTPRLFDLVTSSKFNNKKAVFSNNPRSLQLSGKIIF